MKSASPRPIPTPASAISPAGRSLSAVSERYEHKRAAILGAAAKVFNELGIKGGTLSEVAARVGLATNSVTYYYRKKEALACACFLESIEAQNQNALLAAHAVGVEARVREFMRQQAQMLAGIATGARPPLIVFSELRALDGEAGARVHRAYNDMYRAVRSLLKGPGVPEFGRADLNARAHILLSNAHFMRAWVSKAEPDQYMQLADRVSDIVLHGIAAPGSAWSTGSDAELDWRLLSDSDPSTERFLQVATRLLNAQGYRGASVDRICAQLNVTKGSFYHHIERKDDLILACFERTLAAVRRASHLAERSPGSGWDRAGALARVLARFQLSERGPMLRVSALGALPDPVARTQAYRRMFQLSARTTDLIVTGMMDGSIRPLDPDVAAQCLLGSINAAAELKRWISSIDEQSVIEHFVHPILDGILCPSS